MSDDDLEELLRPSLDDSHDALGIEAPWNPTAILLIAFFFGFISGGILMTSNARRLGRPDLRWRIILVMVLGSLAVYASAAVFTLQPWKRSPQKEKTVDVERHVKKLEEMNYDVERWRKWLDEEVARQKRSAASADSAARHEGPLEGARPLFRLLWKGLAVLTLYVAARPLWKRFTLAEVHDIARGKLLRSALFAIAIGLAIDFGMIFGLALLLGG